MPTDFLKQVQAIYAHRTIKGIIAIQDKTTDRLMNVLAQTITKMKVILNR